MYTLLNITAKRKKTAATLLKINEAVFTVVTTQQLDNTNDFALTTLVRLVILTLS